MVEKFKANFCPFGWLDIKAAISMGHEAGLDPDECFDIVEQLWLDIKAAIKNDYDIQDYSDVDPVYCVYEHILQMARNEINDLTGFDFVNDGAEIYTAGNFMCTSYDYKEEHKAKLIEKLAEHDVIIDDMEQITRCFLDNCEISQADIDAAKVSVE